MWKNSLQSFFVFKKGRSGYSKRTYFFFPAYEYFARLKDKVLINYQRYYYIYNINWLVYYYY